MEETNFTIFTDKSAYGREIVYTMGVGTGRCWTPINNPNASRRFIYVLLGDMRMMLFGQFVIIGDEDGH